MYSFVGISLHSKRLLDACMFMVPACELIPTVVTTARIAALEFHTLGYGAFIDLISIYRAFVVNIGDMMEREVD